MISAGDGEPVREAMRWGLPPNAGAYCVTIVRNVASGFRKPWLKVEQRCIVPVAQFAEPDPEKPKPRAARWFARRCSSREPDAAGQGAAGKGTYSSSLSMIATSPHLCFTKNGDNRIGESATLSSMNA